MKNRNQNKWIAVLLTLFLVVALVPALPAQAASATVTLTLTKDEVRVGDKVEVLLTIAADATIGDFEGFLRYDSTILQFESAPACITGGDGNLRIADIGASASVQERSYRIVFEAKAQGSCELALQGRPVVYSYTDGTEMSVTGFSKTFQVLAEEGASDNGALSALHLITSEAKTTQLSPEFTPETLVYYATVPYEVTDITVSGLAQDAKAGIQTDGEKGLTPGNNEIHVTVTAENGAQKIYTVHVYRTEVPGVAEEPEHPMQGNSGVTFERTEEGVFVFGRHVYQVMERPNSMAVPDGYMETTLFLNDIQVMAYTKQGGTGEFLLLVLASESGEIGWYRYDRLEQTVQRVSNESFTVTEILVSGDAELQKALLEYEAQNTAVYVVMGVLCGICLVLLMIIMWLCIRGRRRNDER